MIDEALSILKECERKSFFQLDDRIFLSISIVLIIVFSVFTRETTQDQSNSSQLEEHDSYRTDQRTVPIHRARHNADNETNETDPLVTPSPDGTNPSSDPTPFLSHTANPASKLNLHMIFDYPQTST